MIAENGSNRGREDVKNKQDGTQKAQEKNSRSGDQGFQIDLRFHTKFHDCLKRKIIGKGEEHIEDHLKNYVCTVLLQFKHSGNSNLRDGINKWKTSIGQCPEAFIEMLAKLHVLLNGSKVIRKLANNV